ncbi:Chemotaxis protein CheW [Aquisphaera giovannonii]|uniref:Chemotaxis protein CheW n=1 Tax=Aquisphaera giovannonii TaxID=406548 RepID=A0A5B9VXY1_9BACT|nr:chemotaxis protein CheW [Aquisphaera giovannonii]QEH32480.1 Chemotaxis protein CheW [Aquisphaera giovannonii]
MTSAAAPSGRMFCTFRLDGRLFGFDVLDVKEVTPAAPTTRVPHAPDEVLGLVNIRGHIHLALSIRRLLGMPPAAAAPDNRLVLFKPPVGEAFGVIVDEVSEIRAVEAARIEPFASAGREGPAPGRGHRDLIDCVCELDGELLVVLDARRMLAAVETTFHAT